MNTIIKIVEFLSNLTSTVASSIAIYLFLKNRDKIVSIFNNLLNFSTKMTLTELYAKLERLNQCNANEETQKKEVINIYNELLGQINGNEILSQKLKKIHKKITNAISCKKIDEPSKRSVVSELRENLRSMEIINHKNTIK